MLAISRHFTHNYERRGMMKDTDPDGFLAGIRHQLAESIASFSHLQNYSIGQRGIFIGHNVIFWFTIDDSNLGFYKYPLIKPQHLSNRRQWGRRKVFAPK